MKRAKLNLIIDALLLLCLTAIAGIGLLIKCVLVPGYQRWEIYERNVGLFFWGLDRHQWGTIHFIIGLVFLALLALHIILHWPIIVATWRKLIPNHFARLMAALIFICITILLLAFSYFVKPQIIEQGRGKQIACDQCEIPCDVSQHPADKR